MQQKHLWLLSLLLTLIVTGCTIGQLDLPFGALLYDVSITPNQISPNADGDTDATSISYSLRRTATVDIYFENTAGKRFYFRKGERRGPDHYNVLWGGVIDDPETVDNGYGPEIILGRVLPDGDYTWTIAATDDSNATSTTSGTITLKNADTNIPQIQNFAVVPNVFQPNQDGIADRVSVSYFLTKDVDKLLLYLINTEDPTIQYPLSGDFGLQEPTKAGGFSLSYDGGVDLNAEPPPDGDYQVIAEAHDLAGNSVRVQQSLTISEGGKPRADVLGGEIDWYTVYADGSNPQVDTKRQLFVPPDGKLCFKAIIVNEGAVPIRTAGPFPGQEYQLGENRNTLAEAAYNASGQKDKSLFQQAGVFRFGINFDTTGVDYPYRWAIGRQQDLEKRLIDGQEQWYLLPNHRSEVSGCIIFGRDAVSTVLPLTDTTWWGGLIHESVEIVNDSVDRITVRAER